MSHSPGRRGSRPRRHTDKHSQLSRIIHPVLAVVARSCRCCEAAQQCMSEPKYCASEQAHSSSGLGLASSCRTPVPGLVARHRVLAGCAAVCRLGKPASRPRHRNAGSAVTGSSPAGHELLPGVHRRSLGRHWRVWPGSKPPPCERGRAGVGEARQALENSRSDRGPTSAPSGRGRG